MNHSGGLAIYIDDIFFTWKHGQEKLKVFLKDLDKFHPTLKFTNNSSEENVAFLDLKVRLKQGKIEMDLDVKSTDRHYCMENHIFLSKTPWKDGFSKKNCAGIWPFLYYWERFFFFPKIWSYPFDGKWKMISLKKICTNIFSSNVLKRWSFKKNCAGIWSCMFLYYLERWYFFPKNLIFFLWAKNERWSFTRNTWKNDFLYICTGATNLILCLPLSPSPAKKNPKKAKMILSHKNTPKVIHILDRYPKNSFHNSLYFYGDLYRRFHILISSEKNQEP